MTGNGADDQRDESGAVRSAGAASSRRSAASSRTWAHDGKHDLLRARPLALHVRPRRRPTRRCAIRSTRAEARARLGGARRRGGGGGGGGRGGAPARPIYEATRHDVVITVPKDKPQGTVVLRGARILTMKGERGHPEGRHRREGQPHRRRRAAGQGARFRRARRSSTSRARRSCPGYVDIHAHIWPAFGVHRSQPFEYLVNLAYGVTTTRDPQTSTTDVLSYERHGGDGRVHRTAHPRHRARASSSATNIRTLDDARDVLKKYSEFYNTETIKQYMAGDRRVAPVHHHGGARAAPHADARGWSRLQEEPDRGDGRLRRAASTRCRSRRSTRTCCTLLRATRARRGRRRSSCSTAVRGRRTTGTRTPTS